MKGDIKDMANFYIYLVEQIEDEKIGMYASPVKFNATNNLAAHVRNNQHIAAITAHKTWKDAVKYSNELNDEFFSNGKCNCKMN